jgi:HK97 family phage prohead protease
MALQGYAVRYDQIIPNHHGENKLILPSAFDWTLNSRATVKLTLSHHGGDCVGSTDDNLELYSDHNNGLAYRFRFPETAVGRQAVAMAKSNEHSEVSIGFDYRNARKLENMVVPTLSWLSKQGCTKLAILRVYVALLIETHLLLMKISTTAAFGKTAKAESCCPILRQSVCVERYREYRKVFKVRTRAYIPKCSAVLARLVILLSLVALTHPPIAAQAMRDAPVQIKNMDFQIHE